MVNAVRLRIPCNWGREKGILRVVINGKATFKEGGAIFLSFKTGPMSWQMQSRMRKQFSQPSIRRSCQPPKRAPKVWDLSRRLRNRTCSRVLSPIRPMPLCGHRQSDRCKLPFCPSFMGCSNRPHSTSRLLLGPRRIEKILAMSVEWVDFCEKLKHHFIPLHSVAKRHSCTQFRDSSMCVRVRQSGMRFSRNRDSWCSTRTFALLQQVRQTVFLWSVKNPDS
jgi:hypothetical protein